MKILEIGMAQSLVNCDAIMRIKYEHFAKKVQGLFIHIWEESIEGSLFDE